MTCFTCSRSRSNDECNRKAIDESCAMPSSSPSAAATPGRQPSYACLTTHRFSVLTSKTIYVEKKCVNDCVSHRSGCVVSSMQNATNKDIVQVCVFRDKFCVVFFRFYLIYLL